MEVSIMKKRIGTREYDTDKAKLVGKLASDKPVNDFGYYEEKLYRKMNGTYFLWGKGNGLTKYAAKDAGEENPVSHLDDNGNWVNVSYALTDSYGHPMKWYWSTGAALDGFMNHCDDPNYDEWDSLECYLEDENDQVERRNFTISI